MSNSIITVSNRDSVIVLSRENLKIISRRVHVLKELSNPKISKGSEWCIALQVHIIPSSYSNFNRNLKFSFFESVRDFIGDLMYL